MSVSSLPLAGVLKDALLAAGLGTAQGVVATSPQELSSALGVSVDQASAFKREVLASTGALRSGSCAASGQSALHIMQERSKRVTHIVTFCEELDALLGGGVAIGEVTEICGAPGVGKTQLCMQLALDVQIPSQLGGVGGSAVYIDAEGSLMPERLEQMAEALSRKLTSVARKRAFAADPSLVAAVDARCSVDALLERVHVFRVTSAAQQAAAVHGMGAFLLAARERAGEAPVRLLVLDSVAFHHRYAAPSSSTTAAAGGGGSGRDPTRDAMASRARQLQALSQSLHRIAAEHQVAVVVVNQMTTKSSGIGGGGEAAAEAASSSVNAQASTLADGTLVASLPPAVRAALFPADYQHQRHPSVATALVTAHASGSGGAVGGAGGSVGTAARLVPALGEVWVHCCTHRLLLGYAYSAAAAGLAGRQRRAAQLVKSASQRPGIAPYAVTADGIRSSATSNSTSAASAARRPAGKGEGARGGGPREQPGAATAAVHKATGAEAAPQVLRATKPSVMPRAAAPDWSGASAEASRGGTAANGADDEARAAAAVNGAAPSHFEPLLQQHPGPGELLGQQLEDPMWQGDGEDDQLLAEAMLAAEAEEEAALAAAIAAAAAPAQASGLPPPDAQGLDPHVSGHKRRLAR